MLLVVNGKLPKPGSVSLVTTETSVGPVTLELGLVLEEILIKPTHVETKLLILQTMVINILRPWDICWCSERKRRQTKSILRGRSFITCEGGGRAAILLDIHFELLDF